MHALPELLCASGASINATALGSAARQLFLCSKGFLGLLLWGASLPPQGSPTGMTPPVFARAVRAS
eukprot:9534031-Alexandrium_andersonii.AAC.1